MGLKESFSKLREMLKPKGGYSMIPPTIQQGMREGVVANRKKELRDLYAYWLDRNIASEEQLHNYVIMCLGVNVPYKDIKTLLIKNGFMSHGNEKVDVGEVIAKHAPTEEGEGQNHSPSEADINALVVYSGDHDVIPPSLGYGRISGAFILLFAYASLDPEGFDEWAKDAAQSMENWSYYEYSDSEVKEEFLNLRANQVARGLVPVDYVANIERVVAYRRGVS